MMDYFTKNKLLFWCVIILALVNVVTLVSFWTRKPPVGPRRGEAIPGGGQIMAERLGLSDEQAKQFEQIRNEHFMRARPLQDDMHKIKMDLLDELFSSETNEEEMQALFAELGAKQIQFEKNLYQHFRELKDACNDEKQVEELKIMLRDLIESTRPRAPQRRLERAPEERRPGEMPPRR